MLLLNKDVRKLITQSKKNINFVAPINKQMAGQSLMLFWS